MTSRSTPSPTIEPPEDVAPARKSKHLLVFILLLLLGGECWKLWASSVEQPTWVSIGALAALLIAAVVDFPTFESSRSARRRIWATLEKIRHPSPGGQYAIAAILTVIATLYLYWTAVRVGRSFAPMWHDEFSYLLQARMFASGHLWMPSHPLADFFDTFYVLSHPVYASERFPGLTLMLIPGVWLGWPGWVTELLISGGCAGLVYLVMTRLIDGLFGLLAVLLLLSGVTFRIFSVMIMAQNAVILLGLGLILAWLQWRQSRRAAWMMMMGVLGGWLAVTRPMDAICYLVPVAIAVLVDLRPWSWKRLSAAILLAVVGAAPFLTLQLTLDKGLTGRLLETPFSYYNQQNAPELTFGFSHPSNREPQSALLQKHIFYDQTVRPWVRRYTPRAAVGQFFTDRLPATLKITLPSTILLLLMPIGLLELRDRKRWVLFCTMILFLGLYTFYPLFTFYHPLVCIPAALLLLGLGLKAIERLMPGRLLGTLAPMVIIGLICLGMMPPIDVYAADIVFRGMSQDGINAQLAAITEPSVVLFRFTRGCSPDIEPVYNIHNAWPDDARIIRAHDLGSRDGEIISYYGARQPSRLFYLYDLASHRLVYLGTAGALDKGLAKIRRPTSHPGGRP